MALLSWAARDRPLALALEDLHAADRSSLELVAYAGRRITRQPVLLVLTRRRLPPRPELDAVLGALRARGTLAAEFDLGPLPAAALDELVGLAADSRRRAVSASSGSRRETRCWPWRRPGPRRTTGTRRLGWPAPPARRSRA